MKVQFVDLKAQYQSIKPEVDAAIAEGARELRVHQRPRLRERVRRLHGAKHCVGLANGTDALFLAMQALGFGPGDEVITAANTFIATAEGISWTGATPVFVDCDPVTYTLDPAKLEAAITPRTRAIVPVHLYGQPADMDPIMADRQASTTCW